MPKKRSWKPKRRGGYYCSPACGGGCTRAAYLLARKRGMNLAIKLGPGWKYEVWENLGWHYMAVSPDQRVSVSEHTSIVRPRRPYYTVYVDGGRYAETRPTLRQAMNDTLIVAISDRDRLAGIEKFIIKPKRKT